MKITIVIPAYRAEKFITKSLRRVEDVLRKMTPRYEIICVVDGKIVDKTYDRALVYSKTSKGKVRVLGYPENLGKGYAVRYGIRKAKGNIIGFIDPDLDINPEDLYILYELFQLYKADVIVGSKRHAASIVHYSWQRKAISLCYQLLVKFLFRLPVDDTQAGIKLFERSAIFKILPKLKVNTWAFDVEILVLLKRLGYKRVYEAPIHAKVRSSDNSVLMKDNLNKAIMQMIRETLRIFYMLNLTKEYDIKKRR